MTAEPSSRGLRILGAASVLPYAGLLAAMHFRSVASEPGHWLDGVTGYWSLLGRLVSRERLRAEHDQVWNVPEAAWFTACWIAAALLYLALLRLVRERRPSLRVLVGLAAACAVPLLFFPNVLSTDIFQYIQDGRVYAVHGANPYVVPPASFPDDPYLPYSFWKSNTSPYGPAWVQVCGLLTLAVEIAAPALAGYVLAYKGLALGMHLLAGLLIWKIAGAWSPGCRSLAAAIWLLNPLCLVEFAGSGHNDALMIVWILAGVLAYQRGRWPVAIGALTLAALTKLYALPALLLFLILALREAPDLPARARRLGVAVLIGLGLGALLYLGLWHEGVSIADDPSQRRALNSLGETVGNVLFGLYVDLPRFFLPASRMATHNALRVVALAVPAMVFLMAAWLARDLRRTVTLTAWGFFAFCTVGALWFWPWYVTVLVALTGATLAPGLGRASILLSLTAPLVYVSHAWVGEEGVLQRMPPLLHRYKPVLIFLPPLVVAAVYLTRKLRSRGEGAPAAG